MHLSRCSALRFTPSPLSRHGTAKIRHTVTGTADPAPTPAPEVRCVAFHPLTTAVAFSLDAELFVADAYDGAVRAQILLESTITHVVASRDYLAVLQDEGQLSLLDWKSLRLVRSVRGEKTNDGGVVAFARASPYLCCTSGRSKYVLVYHADPSDLAGVSRRPLQLNCKQPVTALTTHPSQPILATYHNGGVSAWNYESGELIASSEDFTRLLQSNGVAPTSSAFLSFSADGSLLCVGTEATLLATLRLNLDTKTITLNGNAMLSSLGSVASARFHPRFNVVVAVAPSGIIACWDINCQATGNIQVGFVTEQEAVDRSFAIPPPARPPISSLTLAHMELHPTLNAVMFTYSGATGSRQADGSHMHIVYALSSHLFPLRAFLPMVSASSSHDFVELRDSDPAAASCAASSAASCAASAVPPPAVDGSDGVALPMEDACALRPAPPFQAIYVKGDAIVMENWRGDVKDLWEVPVMALGGSILWPSMMVAAPTRRLALLFVDRFKIPDTNVLGPRAPDSRYCVLGLSGGAPTFRGGRDGCFLSDTSLVALAARGSHLDLCTIANSAMTVKTVPLPFLATRVFAGPAHDSVLLLDAAGRELRLCAVGGGKKVTAGAALSVPPHEEVCEVVWARSPRFHFAAVVCTHSVRIVDERLEVVAEHHTRGHDRRPHFFSAFWAGPTLLFSSTHHLHYLTVGGRTHPLAALSAPGTVITGVASDRVMLAKKSGPHVVCTVLAVGLLEPLVLGELALLELRGAPLHTRDTWAMLRKLVSCFDYRRVSRYFVAHLEAVGLPDLALSLVRSSHLYPLALKLRLAVRASRFDTAFDLLVDDANHKQTVSQQELCAMFHALGKHAAKFGQFEIAHECFMHAGSTVALLQLFAMHRDVAAIEQIHDPQLAFAQMHLVSGNFLSKAPASEPTNRKFEVLHPSYQCTAYSHCSTHEEEEGEEEMPTLGLLDALEKWFELSPAAVTSAAALELFATFFTPSAEFAARIPVSPFEALQKRINKSKKRIREQLSQPTSIVLEPEPRKDVNNRKHYTIADSCSLLKGVVEIHAQSGSVHDDANNASHTEVDSVLTSTNADDVSDGEEDVSEAAGEDRPELASTLSGHAPLKRLRHLDDIAQAARSLAQSSQGMRLSKQYFQDALELVEQGFWVPALEAIQRSIRSIVSSGDPSRKRKEIKIAVAYKLALRLAIEIELVEKSPLHAQSVARLLRLLSCVPVRSDHRVVFLEIAVEQNILNENYKSALQKLSVLRTRPEIKVEAVEEQMQACNDAGGGDSVPIDESNGVNRPRSRFCYETFVQIDVPPFTWCPVCDAVYSLEAMHAGDACTYCESSAVERKDEVTPPNCLKTIRDNLPPPPVPALPKEAEEDATAPSAEAEEEDDEDDDADEDGSDSD
eukprot:TRINITY_DN1535_c0_g1_i3.p1 TRINITY_DN1535_c0_g1~~TRINITY_DN1535_c0_g1_i3.p1  ORF type:complete len:1394 (+),score=576.55 TRINITY_DN1535_c0_g1_i3:434-4615(+)